METPKGFEGELTERLMAVIRDHLQPDEPGHPHHYNRVYSAVYEVLKSQLADAKESPAALPEPLRWMCRACAAAKVLNGRKCGFLVDGSFTPNNWNCATLNRLSDLAEERSGELYGADESCHVIASPNSSGFVILTRYKRRGKCSSATISGDFWPSRPLTLREAERLIDLLTR